MTPRLHLVGVFAGVLAVVDEAANERYLSTDWCEWLQIVGNLIRWSKIKWKTKILT